jgi:replicative DNA helicase
MNLEKLQNHISIVDKNQPKVFSLEAEQAVLGAILLNNECYFKSDSFLLPIHFSEEIHQRIYDLISETIKQGKVADPICIKNFLGDHKIGSLSMKEYLSQLVTEAASLINVYDYSRLIYDLFIRRGLIKIAQDVVFSATHASIETDPETQIEEAEKQLYELAERQDRKNCFIDLSSAVSESNEILKSVYQNKNKICGISSGFKCLDELIGGFQRSNLIILAGRPGMGKTSFATNIALNMLKNPQGAPKGIGFFSLEMSSEELATRMISDESRISSFSIRKGDLSELDYGRVTAASNRIKKLPLYIDDTGGLSIDQLVIRARRLKRQKGIDLLIIDYLQYLSGKKRAMDSRVNEISEITNALKALAKELKIPIIALSQLSRQVENRDNKRPVLSDLRDSGSIEQDADIVIFLYREVYYLKQQVKSGDTSSSELSIKIEECENKAQVIIAKNRHGPVSDVNIGFDAQLTKFYDL